MLSRTDIVKELGKGICVYPFSGERIKGNALNLTVSEYAWTLCSGSIWIDSSDNAYSVPPPPPLLNACTEYKLFEKQRADIEHKGVKYVALLPFSTTLIETNEIISVGNNIGGEYNSKVKMVSKGTCHIGTYLEPNYRGHSLIAIHSISQTPILLRVNSVFAAITFFYLHREVSESLRGAMGSRFEILDSVGISLSECEKDFLSAQWKNDTDEIKTKMISDSIYKDFIKNEKRKAFEGIKKYFNVQNILVLLSMFLFLFFTYKMARFIDTSTNQTIWVDRFWNVGCSGIIICILGFLAKFFKD